MHVKMTSDYAVRSSDTSGSRSWLTRAEGDAAPLSGLLIIFFKLSLDLLVFLTTDSVRITAGLCFSKNLI